MDANDLPACRPCSCGAVLDLICGVMDRASGQIRYHSVIEAFPEQLDWWAQDAMEYMYGHPAAVRAYRASGLRPYHDLLHADGHRQVAGAHAPSPEPLLGVAANQQRAWERVMREALQQDNYGDYHAVLARAGLLEPFPPRLASGRQGS